MAVLSQYDWIIALISIAFCGSSFGNGANDVSNSFATSVAARSLTMPQVGLLSMCTEFFGAVVLGARVTGTIKNDIIDLDRFRQTPSTLILAMGCAEFASAFWLLAATKLGYPVSTTQTIVGALVGVGIAAQAQVSWSWKDGSVTQIAASWGVAPCIAAVIGAVLFASIKFTVLEREKSFEKAMRVIPFYLAFTAAVLALFITVEAPGAPSLEELGAGIACGIVLGVFFGALLLAYVFFVPYVHRRLVKEDPRIRLRHIFLGPLLYMENPPIYMPAKGNEFVIDYYASAHDESQSTKNDDVEKQTKSEGSNNKDEKVTGSGSNSPDSPTSAPLSLEDVERGKMAPVGGGVVQRYQRKPEPEERFLAPTAHLPIQNPKRIWSFIKYFFLQGVTRDCVTHASDQLSAIHAKAKRYDNRVEHVFTYAQVASAMMMSIAHGSNDVANAIGPFIAAYQVYMTGEIREDGETPIWILVAAGFLLGAGFWFMGHHIMKAMGNKITQMSPTRGFAMELAAAITVLLASRLGLPVSTTQCLTGAVIGVALMNFDVGAVNWRQVAFIFSGWIVTLPCAGLIGGLLMAMSLNTPQFGQG
ncbi:phosphate transporter [Colletotrichum graminicola]|uniref:Phosphate transporter n=1 Tax=Colletotrichum graminicola (strain M1.001 / M2 / FGSC 10212) TaxID=645133 RepID=E3QXT6_COLGM|nr:phosphate transporter [Colletotrichum graminicola M1.001]EFQ35674.1 phosphate transporter [Colletotrichum graminicola M1.001]WDK14765.1 phosphate transporter [Colletotrichum graminicola]